MKALFIMSLMNEYLMMKAGICLYMIMPQLNPDLFSDRPKNEAKSHTWKIDIRFGRYYQKRVIHAWRKLDVNCFYASAKLLFIYKNFMASGQLITPQKNYDDVGVFYRTPLIYNFNVGYNLNNWNFELGTRNPFSTFVKR